MDWDNWRFEVNGYFIGSGSKFRIRCDVHSLSSTFPFVALPRRNSVIRLCAGTVVSSVATIIRDIPQELAESFHANDSLNTIRLLFSKVGALQLICPFR